MVFPKAFVVLGMRYETQNVNLAAIEVDRGDQAILVPTGIEHDHNSPAVYANRVRVGINPAHVGDAEPPN